MFSYYLGLLAKDNTRGWSKMSTYEVENDQGSNSSFPGPSISVHSNPRQIKPNLWQCKHKHSKLVFTIKRDSVSLEFIHTPYLLALPTPPSPLTLSGLISNSCFLSPLIRELFPVTRMSFSSLYST